jgi:hypothetical protein
VEDGIEGIAGEALAIVIQQIPKFGLYLRLDIF